VIRGLLALVFAAAPVTAQEEESAADRATMSAAWKAQDAGRVLEAEAILRAQAFDAAGQAKPGFLYDQWAHVRSLLTGVPALRVPSPGDMADRIDPADPGVARIAHAVPRDAVAAIVERARRTRVVILNEDHASPRDRAFGLEVARALRPLGYTLFGAETFTHNPDRARAATDMARLASEGYPRRMTGVYTRDPAFGDFVRQTLALGYRPFAYEQTNYDRSGDWKARIARCEQEQAETIARVLRENPGARLFVHVGFHHATERPAPDGEGPPNHWMATRLKAMTGIDPLTIDQTILNDSGSGIGALHRKVAGKLGERPAVLFDGKAPLVLGEYRGLVDLQVAHPPLRWVNGRPDWLAGMGRKPTPIPPEYLPSSGTRLVQAFVASEAEDAIPVDQVLVTAGTPAPMLMLPAVPVRYAVQDPDGASGGGACGAP